MKNIIIKNLKKFPWLYSFSKYLYINICQISTFYKWKTLPSKNEVFLELGSGVNKKRDGWITVDMYDADINYDLRKGIPLPNNTVNKIYTSHMLEHIPYKQLKIFINECYRVLKERGELLVSVPNARLYIASYIQKKSFRKEENMYQPALIKTGSWIDQLNYIAYLDELHCYMFDEENLVNTLKLAPFSKVNLRSFDTKLDKSRRDFTSIYASAIK